MPLIKKSIGRHRFHSLYILAYLNSYNYHYEVKVSIHVLLIELSKSLHDNTCFHELASYGSLSIK